VDTGLNENQAEFAIFVLAVALKMLANGDGLLDELIEVFWDFWRQTVRLEDSENLVSGDDLDLCDTVRITEQYTNLRRGVSLLGKLANLILHLIRGGLQPSWRVSAVWDGGGCNALAVAV